MANVNICSRVRQCTGKGVNRMTKDNDESVIVSLINDEE